VAIKKVRIKPPGYTDIVHPETSADIVKFSDGTTVEEHKADDVSQREVHGFRVNEDKALEFFNGEEWVCVQSGTVNTIVDMSNAPGNKVGIGTMEEGFFGEVPASELFSASEIASACGISQGVAQFENEPWLKFVIDGKIIFKPRKPIRHTISWDTINAANCVYGGSEGKRVTKNGQTYIVRLMKGAIGSEWNRLMLPIHEQAIDKSWAYPANVGDNVPIWSHNFGTGVNGMYTDADLMTHKNYGNGSYIWCQEKVGNGSVCRGLNGVSYYHTPDSSSTFAHYGWSPVLELVS